jgi:hypothetical protein
MQFSAHVQEATMSRFTRHLCAAAVVLAVVAPAAGAAVYRHSPGLTESFAAPQVGYAHSPDVNPYRSLEAFSPSPSPSPPAVSTTTTTSFDWADAGIGAGALAALLLLAGATAIVARKSTGRRVAV